MVGSSIIPSPGFYAGIGNAAEDVAVAQDRAQEESF